jgi:hypothetical protein
MDGALAVGWVLQDYETGVWSFKRRIILPEVELWVLQDYST